MKNLLAVALLTSCGALAQEDLSDKDTTAGKAISGQYTDEDGVHDIPQSGPIVIDISASWCGACNEEAQSWSKYLGDKAPLVPVVTLMFKQNMDSAKKFKAKYKSSWDFGMDTHGLFEKYCNDLLPCNLVVVDGIIKIQKDGELNISSAEKFTGKWK